MHFLQPFILHSIKEELKVHKESVHNVKIVNECTLSEKTGKSIEQTEEHLLKCDICDNIFKTRTMLKAHIISKEHALHCEHCLEEATNKDDLKSHIENRHTYDCETCGYTGIGEETMEDHILERHAQPEINGMYKCDDCAFQCKDKSSFGEHYNYNSKTTWEDLKPCTMKHLKKQTILSLNMKQG